MSCNDLKWSYSDASAKLIDRSNRLDAVESRRSDLGYQRDELTRKLQTTEARIERLEDEVRNADDGRRSTLQMELESEKRYRDETLTNRAHIDGALRSVRAETSDLQEGIASARNAKEGLRSQWEQEGCEGRIY